MDLIHEENALSRSPSPTAPTAKLHVLGLAPLKKRLGKKWGRLSALVHKLFEKAIRKAQRPTDHFVVLDELSYAVTFSNMTLAQTSVTCIAIAREVCENLFGDQIDEISVRCIIAEIVAPLGIDTAHVGAQIEAILERCGAETIITQRGRSGVPDSIVSIEKQQEPRQLSSKQIENVNGQLFQVGAKLGLFPVWELSMALSSLLFLAPFAPTRAGSVICGRSSLGDASEAEIIDIELALLNVAAAYAARVRNEDKICALAVGVSYDSLCCFRSRIRYVTALQKVVFSPSSPLLIRIEQIPKGAPDNRIGELVAMLSIKNVRLTLEFQTLAALRQVSLRLGAAAIGGPFPSDVDDVAASAIVEMLVSRASTQRAYAFVDHLDTPARVVLAKRSNVRFGRGKALSTAYYSGLEDVPVFPLTLLNADSRSPQLDNKGRLG